MGAAPAQAALSIWGARGAAALETAAPPGVRPPEAGVGSGIPRLARAETGRRMRAEASRIARATVVGAVPAGSLALIHRAISSV